jgi:hypothetical protein
LKSLGLVGRIVFSLFLGLRMVGEETGDLPLSFLPVWTTEGLSPLMFFVLTGFNLPVESTNYLSIGSIYFIDFILLGYDFSDFIVVSCLVLEFTYCFGGFSLCLLVISIFLIGSSIFLELSTLLTEAPDFLSLEASVSGFLTFLSYYLLEGTTTSLTVS